MSDSVFIASGRLTAPSSLAYLFGGIFVATITQQLYPVVRGAFSSLRLVPGPRSESRIWGDFKKTLSSPNLIIYDQWAEAYGPVYAFRAFLSKYRLVLLDIHALGFVMNQDDVFHPTDTFRRLVSDFLGNGLLFVVGDDHRRQRRIMQPAFAVPHIRALSPIFWRKAFQLKDVILSMPELNLEGKVEIDVLSLTSRTAMDIIGAAGFDHEFNSLDNNEDELAAAFKKGSLAGSALSLLSIINMFVPGFRYIMPDANVRARKATAAIMRRIGSKIVQRKKASIVDEVKTGSAAQARDLLSLLIKSNTAPENEGAVMSDDEVLAQISTFLFAGNDTTSLTMAWALYALARHPDVQRKLRQELLECGLGDEPNMTDLDKLSYLDGFVRETLRLYPAAPIVSRQATCDTHVPVSQSFKDRTGAEVSSIPIQKGEVVTIPIATINRKKDIWGEDATDFRPERWDNPPAAIKDMPGIWGNLLTFIQGKRSCLGFRFAVTELKILLYVCVRAIEFDINPSIRVDYRGFSTRPYIVSHPEKGGQMPLICKPVSVI